MYLSNFFCVGVSGGVDGGSLFLDRRLCRAIFAELGESCDLKVEHEDEDILSSVVRMLKRRITDQ